MRLRPGLRWGSPQLFSKSLAKKGMKREKREGKGKEVRGREKK